MANKKQTCVTTKNGITYCYDGPIYTPPKPKKPKEDKPEFIKPEDQPRTF